MKKFALRAVAVVVGLIVLDLALGHISPTLDLGSHACTAFSKLVSCAKKEVPLEWEVDRLRHELTKIEPDMHRNFSVLAEEEVAVENLKKDIADGTARLDKEKKNILTMKADLESGTEAIVYSGVKYPASRIREKLSNDFESYKRAEEALKAKKELLTAKENAVAAALQQLDEMRSVKAQFETQLAQMEAEIRLVRVAQSQSKFKVDDSRLSRIKESMQDMRNRLEAAKRAGELEQRFANDTVINVEHKAKTNEVLKDIDAHFGPKDNGDKVAADKE